MVRKIIREESIFLKIVLIQVNMQSHFAIKISEIQNQIDFSLEPLIRKI